MTVEEAGSLLAGQPGAVEGQHHGHPDFRIDNQIFGTLWPDKGTCVLRLPIEFGEALAAEEAGRCRIVSRTAAAVWVSFEVAAWESRELTPHVELAAEFLGRAKKA